MPTLNWLFAYFAQNYWIQRLRELQRCVTVFNGSYSLPDSSLVFILSVGITIEIHVRYCHHTFTLGITIARVYGVDAPLVMRIAYYTAMGLACILYFETWQVTFTELIATIAWAVAGTVIGLIILHFAYGLFERYWTSRVSPIKQKENLPSAVCLKLKSMETA